LLVSIPRYSFVVPIYHDADLAPAFCVEFERVFQAYLGLDDVSELVELIFVNDDGTAETAALLTAVCGRHRFAKLLNLSRNFGQHVALSCGYDHAHGDYVGMLNVDMQDPPDQIPVMLEAMKDNGYDIVLGVREERHSPWLDRMTSRGFNWFLNKATGYDMPLNIATLRIMNRPFVEAYRRLTERSRYLPGLEMWLGFRRGYVPIRHAMRQHGRSSYTFRKRLRLALEAIISFSDLPLRFFVALGAVVAVIGFLLAGYLAIGKLFFVDFRAGFASTVTAILLVGGVLISVVGVASLYIGRVLSEVQARPLYIVRDSVNIPEREVER
jgi:glycosyltransferase involved in cell wall biosynthesis